MLVTSLFLYFYLLLTMVVLLICRIKKYGNPRFFNKPLPFIIPSPPCCFVWTSMKLCEYIRIYTVYVCTDHTKHCYCYLYINVYIGKTKPLLYEISLITHIENNTIRSLIWMLINRTNMIITALIWYRFVWLNPI